MRGGQSCIDRNHPKGVDPVAYHESAHCLRFSKLWYKAYRIHLPKLEHVIAFQMYKRRHPERGSSKWIELTRGAPSILGTEFRSFAVPKYGLVFSYNDKGNLVNDEYLLKGQNYLLKPKTSKKNRQLPFAQGGAKEYLLLDQKLFDFDGGSCDKIGVSFMAFAKQINRCGVPKDTCLYNQPYSLWLHDRSRRKKGLKGKYLLENFAILPNKCDQRNEYSEGRLHLEYHGRYISKLSVSMNNFINNLISTKPYGILSEIYIDAANEYSTTFIINVLNDGLVETTYRVALTNLPEPMPKVWRANPCKNFTIPAHNSYSIKLQTYGKLPLERFHCTVRLLSGSGKLISSRRVIVQNNDRCYCLWECQCACEGSILGLQCDVMDQESYNRAGYQGSPPPRRPFKPLKMENAQLADRRHKNLLLFVMYSGGFLMMGVMNALLRLSVFGILYCVRPKGNKPKWKELTVRVLDGALIPLFVCCKKDKLCNNIFINIFHFFLLVPSILCFLCHVIFLNEAIYGQKMKKRMRRLRYRGKRGKLGSEEDMEKAALLDDGAVVSTDDQSTEDASTTTNEPPSQVRPGEAVSLSEEQTLRSKELWIDDQKQKYQNSKKSVKIKTKSN